MGGQPKDQTHFTHTTHMPQPTFGSEHITHGRDYLAEITNYVEGATVQLPTCQLARVVALGNSQKESVINMAVPTLTADGIFMIPSLNAPTLPIELKVGVWNYTSMHIRTLAMECT